jgi:ferredoxin
MAHTVTRSSYSLLVDRLNRFPQGAPSSGLLLEILKMLFSAREAELVSRLPVRPFTAQAAGRAWSMAEPEARKILDRLAGRALLVDFEQDGRRVYALPPPMAGFFEFSLMRVRDDIDQKALSELFHQYLNVEEDFIRDLFVRGETGLGRAFVHEPALSAGNAVHVLDYERASSVIRDASCRAVGLCYCRHKMLHLGRACDAPLEICMTFGAAAGSLIRHGHAREIDAAEGLDLLQSAYGHGLVQLGENVRENVSFICSCCRCCCEGLLAARRFAGMATIHTTNFIPQVDTAGCTGCGKCVQACPVDAIVPVRFPLPGGRTGQKPCIDEDRCLGCGLCARSCPKEAITLKSRPKRVITPVNGMHRAVVMAIERGTLQHLIFDNRVLWSHRALAGLLGAILRLPPLKQVLASRQVKSRYLEALMKRMSQDGSPP